MALAPQVPVRTEVTEYPLEQRQQALDDLRGGRVRGAAVLSSDASRERKLMADVTVKRLEDFETIFGGGFRRVRAGLGVTSFGIAVMDLPPGFDRVSGARPRPRRAGGGLHRARGQGDADRGRTRATSSSRASSPGSARGEAQDHHRRRGGAGARDRRHPGKVYEAAGVHRGGPARPDGGGRPAL